MFYILFYRTLELLVNYGVFTDEELETRLEREKFWDAYLDDYYENEKRQFQQKYNYFKKLYEDHKNGINPDLFLIQLKNLKLK